jgi:hypothetical protein
MKEVEDRMESMKESGDPYEKPSDGGSKPDPSPSRLVDCRFNASGGGQVHLFLCYHSLHLVRHCESERGCLLDSLAREISRRSMCETDGHRI